MSQPAPDPTGELDPARLAEARRRLEEARKYHEARIAVGPESADDITSTIAARSAVALQEVRAALSSLESGRYGICVSCGDRIRLERLEALPHTCRCAGCAAIQVP